MAGHDDNAMPVQPGAANSLASCKVHRSPTLSLPTAELMDCAMR
jgi:hypothetical protein